MAATLCTAATFAAESKIEAEWSQIIEAARKEAKVSVFPYQRENIEAARRNPFRRRSASERSTRRRYSQRFKPLDADKPPLPYGGSVKTHWGAV